LNNTIRMVTPGGVVTTIGGTAGMTGAQDGVGAAAGFSTPRGVAVTPGGAIYVSDALNARITQGVPSAPPGPVFSADDDVAFTAGDSSVVIPLLGNLTAPPGGTLSITGVTQGRFGRVTINPDGTLTYTPLKTYKDLDSFTYTVSDGLGGAATGTVIIGNGFVTAEGSYSGPVTNDTPASGNSGAIAITVGAGGRFDGKLSLAGSRYAFKGAFDTGWNSRLSITRPDRPEIAVQLRLDPDNNQITGTVADGAFHSAFTAARPASNPPAQREISPSAPPPGPNGL